MCRQTNQWGFCSLIQSRNVLRPSSSSLCILWIMIPYNRLIFQLCVHKNCEKLEKNILNWKSGKSSLFMFQKSEHEASTFSAWDFSSLQPNSSFEWQQCCSEFLSAAHKNSFELAFSKLSPVEIPRLKDRWILQQLFRLCIILRLLWMLAEEANLAKCDAF